MSITGTRGFLLGIIMAAAFMLTVAEAHCQSAEDQQAAIDSSMAYSPDYLPTSTGRFPTIKFNPITYTPIDTSLFHTADYDPLLHTGNLYQSLGINGQAHKSMVFNTHRPDGFSMTHLPYPLYFKTLDDLKLYNMKTSFSDICIYYGIVDEIAFKATHAQRVRQVDFSVNMDGGRNSGYFLNQSVNRFNMDAILRYETPGKIYGFVGGYIFNHGKFGENGGLKNSSEFTNRSPKERKENNILTSFPIMFTNGMSNINQHSGLLTNYVNLKSGSGRYFGTVSHTFRVDHLNSKFFDHDLNNIYYKDIYYMNTDTTNDSIKFTKISNAIQWSNYSPVDTVSGQNYYLRFAGGVRHEYINAVAPRHIGNNLTVFGRVSTRLFKVWELYGDMAYTFFGYNNNDASATAGARFTINKRHRHYVDVEFAFDRRSPDYILTSYYGNNNMWENSLKKENIFHASANWTIFGYKAGFSFYNLGNYAYLNDGLMPTQSEKQIQVIQITAFAPLRIKNFSVDANLALQHSTNQAVTVPLFAGKLSAAYHTKVFRRKLNIQIGLDLMYNTLYMADGYSPILHRFYSQQRIATGNYLYINAHIALKVKRLSFFIRGGNLMAGLISFKYITTPDYPMQGLNMELGLNWKFYD
ncbi:MAG: putative porin [Bacteroidales bacterium]|nr:putative porin [Bacteroidales bacterium]